jgi:hypothetical protein
MRKTVIPSKRPTVIPAKAGIQVLCLTIVVTLVGCTSKKHSADQPSETRKNGKTIAVKDTGINIDSLIEGLDLYSPPGSGGRPITATEDRSFRWDVKTMRDDSDNNWQTRYGMPFQKSFTISELINFDPEKDLGEYDGNTFIPNGKVNAKSPRLWGRTYLHEYQIINIEAHIVGYKFEKDDSDIHLILTDGKDSLIAEVPYWKEVGKWAQPQVESVWKWLRNHFGSPPPKGKIPPDIGPVFVVGMPFIDKDHNVNGAAQNGIEIHPVLGISLTDDN